MVYLFLGLLVFAVNVIPAFMPPTWIVLTLLYVKFNLWLPGVVLIDAICATLGRVVLYFIAKLWLKKVLTKSAQENYQALGEVLKQHKRLSIPLFMLYAFLPIPSNQAYIAAGLADFDIKVIATAFLFGRFISYTFWLSFSGSIAKSLEYRLSHHYSLNSSLLIEVASFMVLVIISFIPWKKLLEKKHSRRGRSLKP